MHTNAEGPAIKLAGRSKNFKNKKPDNDIFQLAFNNSLQANVITTTSNGKIVVANRAACKLLGYSTKELLAENMVSIFGINDISFRTMIRQNKAIGKCKTLVTAIQKNGKRIFCEITSADFTNSDGIYNTIITITDLSQNILTQKNIDTQKEKIVADNIVIVQTKQKNIDHKNEKKVAENIILALAKSDAQLAKNKEWIKYISKTSYDLMWDWNIELGRIYVGDSIEEVFGYTVKNNTVSYASFIECLPADEKRSFEKKLLKTLDTQKKSWEDTFILIRNDGTMASTISRAIIIRGENGKAIRLIGATQDISKLTGLQKKLDDQILVQTQASEVMLIAGKLSFDGRWDLNLITNEFHLGEGFKELFGYGINGKKGNIVTDWSNYIYPADKESVENGLKEAIGSKITHWEQVYRFIRGDGSIATAFNRATILRNSKGKAYRVIGVMQDISERKKAESENEMMIKELMKSNADLKQFSFITSHNLRAPLSNIQSILKIIDHSSLDHGTEDMLKMLQTSTIQLTKTMEDLTRILVIKNNVHEEISTIRLPDAFINLYKTFDTALKDAGATLFIDFAAPEIEFNATYLESILINLFENSIKYRSPKRKLLIHASSTRDKLGNTIFKFADNGSGIDVKRYKDRIFGLYQRFHSNAEGIGLGLYIIKSQLEALNCKIQIESAPDKGATFIITFVKQNG